MKLHAQLAQGNAALILRPANRWTPSLNEIAQTFTRGETKLILTHQGDRQKQNPSTGSPPMAAQ